MKWEEYPAPKSELDHYITPSSAPISSSQDPISMEEPKGLAQLGGGSKKLWGASGYAGTLKDSSSAISRPVYSQFPATSKYTLGITSKIPTSQSSSTIDKKPQKKTKKQSKREKEAAALLGLGLMTSQSVPATPTFISEELVSPPVVEKPLLDIPTAQPKVSETTPPIDLLGNLTIDSQPTIVQPMNPVAPPVSSTVARVIGNNMVSHAPSKFLVGDNTVAVSYFIIRKVC